MGYLVMALRIGERFRIGQDIEVFISDYDSGRVDVAVKAPKEVLIKRIPSPAEEAFRGDSSKYQSRPERD